MLTQNTADQVERPANGTIGDELAEDHRRMEQLLEEIVREASSGDGDRLRRRWSAFEGALLAHLESEEMFLIKAFAAEHPLDAARIMTEHHGIRRRLTEMGVDLDLHCLRADRVAAFVADLRQHARNEEELLYPWTAARLDPSAAAGARRVMQMVRTADTVVAPADRWRIDPGRSTLSFVLRHLVLLEIKGRFSRWGGTVWFDRRDPAWSRVEAWIDLASVDTGDAERDRHLRSSELLNVERFPRAIFISDSVAGFDGRRAVCHGRLSLNGHEVPIDLEVRIADSAASTWAERDQLSCEVTGAIDRQRFGLHWNQDLDVGGLVVGDKVTIAAHIQTATRP